MNTKGFSLVELMVVIAIVALLAAVAVPSYRDYAAKAKMVTVYNLIQNNLDKWNELYSNGGTLTNIAGTTTTGLTSVTFNPSSGTAPTGIGGVRIIIAAGTTFSSAFSAAVTLVYQATDTNGVVSWSCTLTSAALGATNRASVAAYFPSCTDSMTT